jgi:uncharacterized protein (TIGR02611 family)
MRDDVERPTPKIGNGARAASGAGPPDQQAAPTPQDGPPAAAGRDQLNEPEAVAGADLRDGPEQMYGPEGTAGRDPRDAPERLYGPEAMAGRDPLDAPEEAGRLARSAWYRRVAPHLHRARSTQTGALAVRVAVTLLGTAVIITGIILLPLPGPGWLIIFIGLAILSLEYVWARHLLRYAMRQVRRWEEWVRAQSPLVRVAIGLLLLVFLAALAAVAVEASFGRGTLSRWWDAVTP